MYHLGCMRWVVLLFSLLVVGCAHGGELFGFPPTGSDTTPVTTQPSSTDAPEKEGVVPAIVRARIRTRTPVADINRTACSLRPSIAVDGESHAVDVHIGGVTPCATPLEGAIRVNLRVSDADGPREAVLELVVPQGTTPAGFDDFKNGLREIEREMARRLATLERAQAATNANELPVQQPWQEPHRKSSKVLFVSEILWAVTAGVGAAAGLMFVGAAARSGGVDLGWLIAGSGTLLFGTAPMFLAALTTLIIAGGIYAGEP
jgi:hypothetical protein